MSVEEVGSDDRAYAEPAVERYRPIPAAVPAARHLVRKALRDLEPGSADPEVLDLLTIAANELTTNAVLHARTDFTVRVLVSATWIRIEVRDGNSRMPQACLTPADATSGRGLAIVDGTGLRWGADRHPGGKTVWVQGDR